MERSGRGLSSRYYPGIWLEEEESHEEHQSGQLTARPKFEPHTHSNTIQALPLESTCWLHTVLIQNSTSLHRRRNLNLITLMTVDINLLQMQLRNVPEYDHLFCAFILYLWHVNSRGL
jgi:hypothetical protein